MPSRRAQLDLIPRKKWERPDHGGDLTALRMRKSVRPLDPLKPLHLVLKSSRARGHWSFRHRVNRSRTEQFLYEQAKKRGVTITQLANVGNHLHLLLRIPNREAFQKFLRTISALLPRRITGARKGAPQGKFWDAPAYTRIIEWGRHLNVLKAYFGKNQLEAIGFAGARLRIRSSGEPVVVVGDPKLMGIDPKRVEELIRGGPVQSSRVDVFKRDRLGS